MKYYKNKYKGEYFILSDYSDFNEDESIINDSDITDEFLTKHVDTCIKLGIPIYLGKNEKLDRRIDKVLKKRYENNKS